MLRTRVAFLVIIVGAGLFGPAVLAGQPPTVHSITEGRDPVTTVPILSIAGKGLNKFASHELLYRATLEPLATLDVVYAKSPLLVLRLPGSLEAGPYTLRLTDRAGVPTDLPVVVSNGKAFPGSVASAALAAALRSDLDDASTLVGHGPAYFTDAGNVTAGTLGTDHFSAYSDLAAEGRIGAGATKVAGGDHIHDGVYSPVGHGHSGTWDAIIAAKAYLTVTQTDLTVGSVRILEFNSEDLDTDGIHSTTNDADRLTCKTAGYYLVSLKVLPGGDPLSVEVAILRNGTAVCVNKGLSADPATVQGISATTVLALEEGDYLQARVHAPGTGSFTYDVFGGQGMTEFSVVRLGPAPAE